MKRISIIGLGWLGFQLAEKLTENNFEVRGTTTTEEKIPALSKVAQKVEIMKLDELTVYKNSWPLFLDASIFILTIPPSKIENYATKMVDLLKLIRDRNPKAKVIYTGSSSVYGNAVGEVDEHSPIQPQSPNAKKIAGLEHYFQTLQDEEIAVLRLGGLVGPGRHPVKYLIGKSNIKGKNKGVNLIHSADIAEVVLRICKGEYPSGIYNLCCPEHPLKSDYYKQIAKKMNCSPPSFDKFDNQSGKLLICKKLKQLNYQFIYASPFQFPLE